jgi:signal peptidase II
MFAGLALTIPKGVVIWSWRNGRFFTTIAGGLFSGGDLANAYERVVYGGVFDYVNVNTTFYQIPYSFNLAEVYIFGEVIMIVFALSHKEESKSENCKA